MGPETGGFFLRADVNVALFGLAVKVVDVDILTPNGKAASVLSLIMGGNIQILMDSRILYEYQDVLARPEFGFPAPDVKVLLDYLSMIADHISPHPTTYSVPDAGDLPFMEVALEGRADAIVTGNLRHFPKKVRDMALTSQAPLKSPINYFMMIS